MNSRRLLNLILAAAGCIALAGRAGAQCTELTSGLLSPGGTTWTNQGNLLVAESGTGVLHSGRISIVEPNGTRRPLIDGLPAARADVGEPSGPAGLAMRGRSLYVAMGVGDVAIRVPGVPGMAPRTARQNPAGPSSPLFSSVLLMEFSAAAESRGTGFTLTPADQQALAAGATVVLANGGGDKMTIRMVADFPNFVAEPFPGAGPFPPDPNNIRVSNPFGLIAEGNSLYVTDGGMNQVWRVDLNSGAVAVHAQFPNIQNPFFGQLPPPLGLYPDIEAVPTGIASDGGQLLVSLFTGFPFAPGVSSVQQVDLVTGASAPFITGRKNAIAVHPWKNGRDTSYLVLQYASVGPFFNSPGQLLRFDSSSAAPTLIANCITGPISIAIDEKNRRAYITEVGGRIVVVPIAP
jgi:hypothetical protein